MRSSWLLAAGLSTISVNCVQALSTITISVNTATDCPASSTRGSGAIGSGGSGSSIGNGGSDGGVPSSTTPGAKSMVDIEYGTYGFYGFYPLIPSQSILNGRTTTSDSMSLEYCASYCQGSPFFAVENGQPVYDPSTSLPCLGDAAESCGSPGYAIVYKRGSPTSGSTTVVYTSTNSNGQVTTGTSTSVYPNSSPSGETTIVYTSTNSNGQVTIGTSTSTYPNSSPSGETTIVYTSTNSNGQVTIGTSISTYHASSPTGVATYTSSNADGQPTTITTTAASSSQATDASTSIITETTTDSQGSTYTSTRTTVSTPISSSAVCPGANGQTYSTGGFIYEISCGTDFPGDDLTAIHTDSLPECLLACSNYVPQQSVAGGKPCVAVSWGQGNPGGNCYLKYNIEEVNPFNGGIVSGRKVTFEPANPPRTVSASSAQGGSATSPLLAQISSSSIPNNGGASTTPGSMDASSSATSGPAGGSSSTGGGAGGLPSTPSESIGSGTSTSGQAGGGSTTPGSPDASSSATPGPAGGSSSTEGGAGGLPSIPSESTGGSTSTGGQAGGSSTPTAGEQSSSTTTTTTNPTSNARYPCPDLDNQLYILGTTADIFTLHCNVNYPGNDLITPHYDNFDDCINACDTYEPDPAVAGGADCVAVSWGEGNVGGNCYLKYAIDQINTNDLGFDSAQTFSYIPPSATTTILSTSSPTSSPPTSPTTNLDSGSSSSASGPASPSSTAGGIDSLSGSFSSTNSPESPSSTSGGADSLSSTGGPSSSTGGADGSSSTTAGGSSSSTSPTGTGSTTVYTPIATSPVCPQDNNALYTDVLGVDYNVNCGINVDGDNSQPLHADTFTECILYCDMYAGCAGVTYADGNNGNPATNTNCYPYSTFRYYSSQALQNALYVAIPAAGPNNATEFQDNLCTDPNYGDDSIFTDVFGNQYLIGCGKNLDGSQLACMATDSLEACADYCSLYDGCVAATFTGSGPPGPDQCNCNPLSTTGTSSVSLNVAYAIRQSP
ncbi:MAG: hypothetical protein Q9217_000018 [Psora testacea]